MALSLVPFFGQSVTVLVSGTPVAPGTPVPDNCTTIIVYNTDTTDNIFVAWLLTPVALTVANSTLVPPATAVTLPIGVLSERAQNGGQLYFDASANNTVANLTCVNARSA